MMKELDPHIPVSVCITVADPGFSLEGANSQCGRANLLLPPANVVCEGYVFTGVCLSTGRGMRGCWGACMVACRGACVVAGGCAWLREGCMVARGCAWLVGGMHGWWGACVVARGACVVARVGACVVARGEHVWLWGACVGYDEIQSMSDRYASY